MSDSIARATGLALVAALLLLVGGVLLGGSLARAQAPWTAPAS